MRYLKVRVTGLTPKDLANLVGPNSDLCVVVSVNGFALVAGGVVDECVGKPCYGELVDGGVEFMVEDKRAVLPKGTVL